MGEKSPTYHEETLYRATEDRNVKVQMEITLTTNDIYDWLTHCQNTDTLRYLSAVALRQAKTIEAENRKTWIDVMNEDRWS